jgi:hypothetical protein
MAQSTHEVRDSDVRFRGRSGDPLKLDECLLMTRTGSYDVGHFSSLLYGRYACNCHLRSFRFLPA